MITELAIGSIEQDANAGYVRRLRLFRRADVGLVMDPVRYPLGGAWAVPLGGLLVAEGAVAFVPVTLPRTVRFSESPGESGQGMAYDASLMLEIPKPDATMLAWLHANDRQEWVAVWEDYNDRAWITGNEEAGLRLNRSRMVAGQNVLMLSLSRTLPLPSFPLDGGYELSGLLPGGGFDSGFSLGFA